MMFAVIAAYAFMFYHSSLLFAQYIYLDGELLKAAIGKYNFFEYTVYFYCVLLERVTVLFIIYIIGSVERNLINKVKGLFL